MNGGGQVPKQEKNPNEVLAEVITKKLSTSGLIPANRIADLESKLKTGGVNQEDWTTWVDMATSASQTKEAENE